MKDLVWLERVENMDGKPNRKEESCWQMQNMAPGEQAKLDLSIKLPSVFLKTKPNQCLPMDKTQTVFASKQNLANV